MLKSDLIEFERLETILTIKLDNMAVRLSERLEYIENALLKRSEIIERLERVERLERLEARLSEKSEILKRIEGLETRLSERPEILKGVEASPLEKIENFNLEGTNVKSVGKD